MSHPTIMKHDDTAVLVVDVQEKLIDKILDHVTIVQNIGFLIDGAKLASVRVMATEQYPKGLGKTVPELAERLGEMPEKTAFSCCQAPGLIASFKDQHISKIVLVGIETHVCILQTTLDLLGLGFRVYLAVDAIGSRYAIDRDLALRRMEQAGAILTTVETSVFEWIGDAKHPQFKAMSRLVQDRMQIIAKEK